MRMILRILAILTGLEIVHTALLIWRFPHLADLGMTTTIFGAVTALGWILTLVVGPFAAVQLWRLRGMVALPATQAF